MKITAELLEKLDSLTDDHLFPHSSILKKLNEYDKRASERIWSRVGEIQEQIHKYEKSTRTHISIFSRIFRFIATDWKEQRDVFKISAIRFSELSHEMQKKHSYTVCGDNMRQAIKEYMDEREIDPQRIGLTKDELDSLRYLIPLGFSREMVVKGMDYKPRHDPVPLRPA